MTDLVVLAIVAVIVGLAVAYIVKAKKSGAKCIGCPSGCNCSAKSEQSTCNCGCRNENE